MSRRYPRTSSHGRSAPAKRDSRSASSLRHGPGRQCASPSHTSELPGPPRFEEGCSELETNDTGRPSDGIVVRLRKEAPPQEQSFALPVISPRRLGGRSVPTNPELPDLHWLVLRNQESLDLPRRWSTSNPEPQ